MTTNKIPGLIYPSVQAMPGGNPRDSAILAQQQSSQSQAALANAVGGYKKSRKHRKMAMKYGGASQDSNIVVPQFQMQYKPTGANGQDPNSIIKSGAEISTQGAANSTYDKYASQMGGKYRNKKGGNYLSWGCYNGGSRRKIKNRSHKKTKHSKKNNKKHKKTRKMY